MKLLVLALIFPVLFYAQKTNSDVSNIKDINSIIDSASKLTMSNPELSKQLIEGIKPKLLERKFLDKLGHCYRILGASNVHLANYSDAIYNYSQALNIAKQKKDSINIIISYSGIGITYLEQKEFEKVDSIYQIISPIAIQLKNTNQIIRIKETLGINNFYQHKYIKAIQYYNEALEIAIKEHNSSHFSRLYLNLGIVYIKANQLELATEALIKGKNIAEKENATYYNALYYSSLGELYDLKKLNELSNKYYRMAIDTFVFCQNPAGIAHASVSLAISLERDDKLDEAESNLKNAFTHAKTTNDTEILAYYYIVKANISFKRQNNKQALLFIDTAFSYSNQINELSIKKDLLELEYQVLETLDNYKESLRSYKEYKTIQDSLTNIENLLKVEELMQNQTIQILEKEKEVQNQRLLLSKQRENSYKTNLKITITISTLIVILLLCLYFLRTSKLSKERELALKNESLEKLSNELTELKLEKVEKTKNLLESEIRNKDSRIKTLIHSINHKNDLLDTLSEEPIFKEQQIILKKLKKIIDSEEERAFFNQEITEINIKFHKSLKERFPDLSENDLKLSSMLKMGLSSKDMATLLSISSTSVDVARSRLRKKFNLKKEEILSDFINTI